MVSGTPDPRKIQEKIIDVSLHTFCNSRKIAYAAVILKFETLTNVSVQLVQVIFSMT